MEYQPVSDIQPIPRKSKKVHGDKREVFIALCQSRAYLFSVCEYSLAEYTDVLQAWAERHGLIKDIGQDGVQFLMDRCIAPYREERP